jgi:hypothetical protein
MDSLTILRGQTASEAFICVINIRRNFRESKRIPTDLPVDDLHRLKMGQIGQFFRGVAQLVAHLVWDQGVARSNRVAPTTKAKRLQQEPFRFLNLRFNYFTYRFTTNDP